MRLALSSVLLAFFAIFFYACKKKDNPDKSSEKEAAKRQTLISDFAKKIRQTNNWHRSGQMYSLVHDTTYPVNVYSDTTFAVAMFNDSTVELRSAKVL